jgi:tetratricopeptide (TPR) repeat protein
MKGNMQRMIGAGALGALLALGAGVAFAQTSQSGQSNQSNQANQNKQNPPGQQQGNSGQAGSGTMSNTTGLTLDTTPPPVNAEEDAAYKVFDAVPTTDLAKKIEAGEAFLQKYPESRYRPPIYSVLTLAYIQTGQTQKAFEIGDKEAQLKPDDVQTLAILCQSIPRTINASTPNPSALLDKAEDYGKRALQITPTIAKPANLTDDKFAAAKNETMSMAHSGLGLIDLRRGNLADAITELNQSVTLVPDPDPVNYYLLGIANEKTSHFDAAVAAYTKCAAIPSSLQQTCNNNIAAVKKEGASQLSAPN